ncbi:MAG: F0F1 ATP synthase subunit epsilon, partial [Actinomycetota bacterium]|nr:F0F1 ATP synthase subunit epsilon [Actinomycetota bacterium]
GALDIGQTQLWADDGVVSLAINGGFVEVSGNAVTILSDGALAAQDIDVADAQSDLQSAEQALAADPDDADAAATKKWAETRIQVSEAG